MRRAVLVFGLIGGAVSTAMTLVTIPFIRAHRVGVADVLGYTGMVLSALLVFFGIRWYRETAGAGRVGFGRGFAVGALISMVSCAVLVLAFELVYFKLAPDFGEAFASCMIERARDAGATAPELEKTAAQAAELKRLYDNPATNAALTFGTSFPVGLVATTVSAAILRRR